MAHKFPKGVRVTCAQRTAPTESGPASGHDWEARDASGYILTSGWKTGSKADARDAAWKALEQIGLVVDE